MATVNVDNDAVIQFNTPQSAWGNITHYGVWTTASGLGDANFMARGTLSNAISPNANDSVSFPAGALTLTIRDVSGASGEFTDAGKGMLLGGLTGMTLYISLHTGDPGTTGANEVSTSVHASYARKSYAGGWS